MVRDYTELMGRLGDGVMGSLGEIEGRKGQAKSECSVLRQKSLYPVRKPRHLPRWIVNIPRGLWRG
jgi:hypothetical protein